MDRYPAHELATGDIVLLDLKVFRSHRNLDAEADAMRYQVHATRDLQSMEPVAGPEQSGDNRNREWVHWNAQFQLHSVTLLWKGASKQEDSDYPDDDVEED